MRDDGQKNIHRFQRVAKRTGHEGYAIIYAIAAMVALLGFVSFAVDLGRVQCAKTELQNAVDAAARYAATGLADSTALAKAQSAGGENLVDGSALAIQASDVETGTWDSATRIFTATAASPNAVRITGKRIAARGNAVPLLFAKIMGANQIDVTAEAIASIASAATAFHVAGLDEVKLSGGADIFADGTTLNVASNGSWSGSNGTMIHGNVHYRGSSPSVKLTGSKVAMSSDISVPDASLPGSYTNHGDRSIGGSSTYSISAGDHRFQNLSIGGSGKLSVNASAGDVKIYVTNNLSISGSGAVNITGSNKVEFYMTSPDGVSLSGSGVGRGMLYANQSTLSISGSASWRGGVLAKSINLSGSGSITFDTDYPVPNLSGGGGGGSGGAISMVE